MIIPQFNQIDLTYGKVIDPVIKAIVKYRANYCNQNKLCFQLKKSIELHFNRRNLFLLYFYDAYDLNLERKKFAKRMGSSCIANVFIKFRHFTEKRIDTAKA